MSWWRFAANPLRPCKDTSWCQWWVGRPSLSAFIFINHLPSQHIGLLQVARHPKESIFFELWKIPNICYDLIRAPSEISWSTISDGRPMVTERLSSTYFLDVGSSLTARSCGCLWHPQSLSSFFIVPPRVRSSTTQSVTIQPGWKIWNPANFRWKIRLASRF